MKAFLICRVLLTILMFQSGLAAQDQNEGLKGIQFYKGEFKEALAQAEKEGKLIFIDAYTTWCGPCRRMAANVFPDETVGEFYNANFINMKIDMEKGEGPEIGRKYGVRSYPTFLFVGSDAKVVHTGSGARPVEAFIEMGRDALKRFDKSGDWAKKYESGDRSAETVLAYIKSLNQVGKPSLRIANEYLSAQENLNTAENLEIIFESATEADSRIFNFLVERKAEIVKLKSLEVYESKVQAACKRTFKKAMEYRNEGLLTEAQEKMKNVPSRYEEFKSETSLEYYGATGQADLFLEAAKLNFKKVAGKNPEKYKSLSLSCLANFKDHKEIMNFAEKSAKEAYSLSKAQEFCINYARILHHNGKKTEAIAIVKKGIELAKEKAEPLQMLEYLLRDWGVEY